MTRFRFLMIAICVLGCMAHAGFCLECSLDDAASITQSGGHLLGEVSFQPGHEGKAALFTGGATAIWKTAGNFNPKAGSVELWVKPEWNGDDGKRHSFFHLGGGDRHCTLFKTEINTVRFIYKSNPQAYVAVDIPVSDWHAGEWHHLTASWAPRTSRSEAYGGAMWAILDADGTVRTRIGGEIIHDLPELLFLGRRGADIEHADAEIDQFSLTSNPRNLPFPPGPKPPLNVQIDTAKTTGPFRRVHDMVTLWNTKENPLPFRIGDPWFDRLKEADFRLVRVVAVAESWLWGIGLSRDAQGKLQIDWTDFDRLLDLVKAAGAEPYVRLAYHVPKIMLPAGATGRGAIYSMPKNLDEWSDLMYSIVKHCNVDRKLGIRYWVASLNEGDMTAVRGESDWQVVCDLYERTVKAALRADPTIKVGGPAMANSTDGENADMFRHFLRFCRDRHLPLDFICTHAYHRTHPREYEEHVEAVKQMVHEEWPELHPEYFIDEFNQWANDARADNEYGAAYMAAAIHYQRRAGLTKSGLVAFNEILPLQQPGGVIERHSGPFDKTATQVARVIGRRLDCSGVMRQGILMHPPSGRDGFTFADYRVSIPATGNPRLDFWSGIAAVYPGNDGVTFKVIVNPGDTETVLLDEWQRNHAWKHRILPLGAFAGHTVTLRWYIDPGPNDNNQADWGAIGEPKLLTDQGGHPADVYDFLAHIGDAVTGVARKPYHFVYNDAAIKRSTGLPVIKGTVVTAPYFVYEMYSRMGTEALPVELDGTGGIAKDDTTGVEAARDGHKVTILVWHFDLADDSSRHITLHLSGLPDGTWTLQRTLIDATHTNPYYTYVIKKEPSPDGQYNLKTGKLEVVEQRSLPVHDGRCEINLNLPNMAVTQMELTAVQGSTGKP